MGLSRLDNFLKSVKGNILYVDPNSIDSTDSIENQGNSPTRPFKTIQRALAEAARFSYQVGNNNDRFNKTTIYLQPGDHIVDNRPGLIIDDTGSYLFRSGLVGDPLFTEWTSVSNFNIFNKDNALYKLNSIYGGVIVPRGTSIVGADLRKTKIIPRYVPNPENNNIERSAIFRLTGSCFVFGFTIFDADFNGKCYKDYTTSQFVPNFSHHKLTVFEYVDGANKVSINDTFISNLKLSRTDLDIYYEKIALVYGSNSGRNIIDPVYSSSVNVDIQPVVDEYRIVGSKGNEVNIESISASGTTVTVTLEEELSELSVNSPIEISGVKSTGINDIYNGQYVITSVISPNQITYNSVVENLDTNPDVNSAILNFTVDTVSSASPYVFNCSLRSVYGMCGLHADGSKTDGFKSMVVAQYTGIGLQKDSNAFVRYRNSSGTYQDSISVSNITTNSRAIFKPSYENYHIKASNDAFIQVVSVFAIGYANQFITESGGDISITNSNSNFGAKSLISEGFKPNAFTKDDVGYLTHIISPKYIPEITKNIEFLSVDVGLTTSISVGAGTTTRLYLSDETDEFSPPISTIDGYRIGAKLNDILYLNLSINGTIATYSSRITMPGSDLSKEKSYEISKTVNGLENDIIQSNGVIRLRQSHQFINGEKVRIISNDGRLPDELSSEKIYYVITSTASPGLATSEVKIAQTFNNALQNIAIIPNRKGGDLRIVSRVSDKNSGDIGHPIQYDNTNTNWYINVSSTNNEIYSAILSNGTLLIGSDTTRTYVQRNINKRSSKDSIYKLRYVIPKNSTLISRPPLDGFIIQESNSSQLNAEEIPIYFNDSLLLSDSENLRNPNYICDASWSSNIATIHTELPHKLSIKSKVKIERVTSSFNVTGEYNRGYNGLYEILSVPSSKTFTYRLTINPGTFTNNTTIRNLSLPTYSQAELSNTYQIYKTEEITPYVPQRQDGIYHLYVINTSNSPSLPPFEVKKFSQPLENLYPQVNRDNLNIDPASSICSASNREIGVVNINDSEKSITKETTQKVLNDLKIGFEISNIISTSGTAHTIYTKDNHNLSGITDLTITSSGSGYVGPTQYFAANLVGFAGSTVGDGANATVSINAGGQLSSITIMDPGGNYGIGNTLRVVPAAGIGTTSGTSYAVVTVSSVTNNINDTIEINGISDDFSRYNSLYRVTSLNPNNPKEISVSSAGTISNFSNTLIPSSRFTNSLATFTGKILTVNSTNYSHITGIGTVSFTNAHGLSIGDAIQFGSYNLDFFNKTTIVTNIQSLTSINVDFGVNPASLNPAGSALGYIRGYSYRDGTIDSDCTSNSECISGRNIFSYGGIQSTITQTLTSNFAEDNQLIINNARSLGFKKGDYVLVNKEIFRISSAVITNVVSVFRSLLGSPRQTHLSGSVVRKINIIPIEFRRNSIIRASGHTFEYVGFGPGNYSTAFPERQDRVLSYNEDKLSKSFNLNGGTVNFTGMDNNGDFNFGNRKLKSSTGTEEISGLPFMNVTGEEINLSSGFNISNVSEIIVDRFINVSGGVNGNLISEFNGPVIFNEKVTSNSLEVSSISIRGDDFELSRRINVGISQPTLSGNYGDIQFNGAPFYGDNVGWIYTLENKWEVFGKIGLGNKYVTDSDINAVSGILTCNYNQSSILRTTNTAIQTINITQLPLINKREYEFKVYLNAASSLSQNLTNLNIQIDSSNITSSVRWKGGILPSGISAGYYVIELNIKRLTNSWEVLGEFSTYSL